MDMRRELGDVAGAQPRSPPAFLEGSARPPAALGFSEIFPTFLQGWASLGEKAVYSWLDDRAPTMGAAIAFYTVFSLAPMLVIVIAVAGFVFGQEAAEGALFGELAKLVGPDSAGAVQAMLRSASSTRSGNHRHHSRYWHLNSHRYCRIQRITGSSEPDLESSGGREPRRSTFPQVAFSQPLRHSRHRLLITGFARCQHRFDGLQRLS